MSKSVVVVESPTKARTIGRFLGRDTEVLSSMGHVRDLPESSLGVDVSHGFKPSYVLTSNGKRVIGNLRKAVAKAEDVYLATDPDREGEAIAWHLEQVLKARSKARFHRVTFHEITRSAIERSFEHPGEIAHDLVDAQQARRVVDRLVGYQVSPLLWKNIRKGTSAGRVQSVALRLVCEREREILGFEPEEYWNLDALFSTREPEAEIKTRLTMLDGKKARVPNAEIANELAGELEQAAYAVSNVESTPRKQSASPPFITSTLQQAAGSSLRMGASQTMRIAQQLYEGVDLGQGGPAGLITYMRTDSFNVSKEAQEQVREYIAERYGKEYVPSKPNRYRSRKSAQEAHEAIRPTDVSRTPESIKSFLSRDQYRLYRLIWNRFVASQMAPARLMEHVIDIEARGDHLTHAYIFRASAREVVFPGFQAVYNEREAGAEDEEENGVAASLPAIPVGTACTLLDLAKEQCFTKPPPRYSEATLIRALEQNGVGRPSTYAATVNTIQQRDYVKREKGRLIPTPLGFDINDYLVGQMPKLFDVGFTAQMEDQLDQVEEGNVDWKTMVETFYERFKDWVGPSTVVAAPSNDRARELLEAFPEDLTWHEPVKRGRRTYDDKKFHDSLMEQITEGKKPLSDRQWKALLNLAARYVDEAPGIAHAAEELGVADQLSVQKKARKEAIEELKRGPDPNQVALLDALAEVEFAPPVKRGKRTYDDGKFYRSLRDQVEGGKRLSSAQENALAKLIAKYREQVPGVEELTRKHGLELPEQGPQADSDATANVLALFDAVSEWQPPQKRGRRTYDDREFVESLTTQFANKGALSPRQLEAAKKLAAKYAAQIPEYERHAQALALPAPVEPPVELDVPCPKCGAPLVKRTGRKKPFYGCSTFPKCRFIASELPQPGQEAEAES
jgi:DNA topoisomerase-1